MCSKLSNGLKYEGALGYGSATEAIAGGDGTTMGDVDGVRPEREDRGDMRPKADDERPEFISGMRPKVEVGVRPDSSED